MKKNTFYLFCALNDVDALIETYGETHVAIIRNFLSDQLWANLGSRPNLTIAMGTLGFFTESSEELVQLLTQLNELGHRLGHLYEAHRLYHSLCESYDCTYPLQIGVSTESFTHAGFLSDFAGKAPYVLVPDYYTETGPGVTASLGFGCGAALSASAYEVLTDEQLALLTECTEQNSLKLSSAGADPEKIYRCFLLKA